LLSKSFFPNLISAPFDDGLRIAFAISIALSLVAAIASLLRGKVVIYESQDLPEPLPVDLLGLPAEVPAPIVERGFTAGK
jgi:hypothetical protein